MKFPGKVWRGEESLGITFWVWLIALQLGLTFVDFSFGHVQPSSLDDIAAPHWIMLVVKFALFVWAAVGIWRSSRRAKTVWQILSRIFVILWSLFLVYIMAALVFLAGGGSKYLEQAVSYRTSCGVEFDEMVRTKGADPTGREGYVNDCAARRLKDSMLADHAKSGAK